MKNALVILASILVSTFVSGIVSAAPAIEGKWGTHQESDGMSFDLTFDIQTNSITVTNTCSANGVSVSAHVTSASKYTDTTFETLESAQDQQSLNGVDCSASVMPMQLEYVINGDSLTVSQHGSDQSFVLTRKQ